jgi:hypothetical protein
VAAEVQAVHQTQILPSLLAEMVAQEAAVAEVIHKPQVKAPVILHQFLLHKEIQEEMAVINQQLQAETKKLAVAAVQERQVQIH